MLKSLGTLISLNVFSISFTIFFQNMIISTTLKVMSSWNVTNENNHTVWCYRYWGKLSTVLCCFKHISPRWVGKIFVSISHIAMHCTIQGLTVVFNEACSEGQWHNWLQKEAITYEVIHSKCSYGFGGANTFFWTHQCRHSPFLNCSCNQYEFYEISLSSTGTERKLSTESEILWWDS